MVPKDQTGGRPEYMVIHKVFATKNLQEQRITTRSLLFCLLGDFSTHISCSSPLSPPSHELDRCTIAYRFQGSCSTLVHSQLAPGTEGSLASDPLCALLTCASILLDTGNCDPRQKKATEADTACLDSVCEVLKLSKVLLDLLFGAMAILPCCTFVS